MIYQHFIQDIVHIAKWYGVSSKNITTAITLFLSWDSTRPVHQKRISPSFFCFVLFFFWGDRVSYDERIDFDFVSKRKC